ncbi:MAG: hypothetical protein ACYS26_12465 [Planctomycetota bacterium]|jgi:hypothetical protein
MADAPDTLCYRRLAGYRYQTLEPFELRLHLPLVLPEPARIPDLEGAPWVRLGRRGKLTIRAGYAWNGPSGPAIDTRDFMRASLVHDALYQLMRAGELDHRDWRAWADRVLRDLVIADGMSSVRASWVHATARWFGARYARRADSHPLLRRYAP